MFLLLTLVASGEQLRKIQVPAILLIEIESISSNFPDRTTELEDEGYFQGLPTYILLKL